MNDKKLRATPGVLKALEILRDHPGCHPARFAGYFFPKDHPGWTRVCKCGPKGSTRGSGLVMWAGGFLGKLHHAGLADSEYAPFSFNRKHYLTPAGKTMLEEKGKTE